MKAFLWICLGGAAGSGARYLVSGWALRAFGTGFPYGTFAVNLIGSFALALLMSLSTSSEILSPTARLALTVGVLGGFTTYSTFSYETMRLLEAGSWLLAGINVAATVFLCLVASVLGFACGRLFVGA